MIPEPIKELFTKFVNDERIDEVIKNLSEILKEYRSLTEYPVEQYEKEMPEESKTLISKLEAFKEEFKDYL